MYLGEVADPGFALLWRVTQTLRTNLVTSLPSSIVLLL